MQLNNLENINIEKKEVRHARIQVNEDFSIKIIVPMDFTDEELLKLKQKKMSWILDNLDFFSKSKNQNLDYSDDEILLFDKGYKFIKNGEVSGFEIDHENNILSSKKELFNPLEVSNFYKNLAQEHIERRTKELAKKYNFSYEKIFIRNQKTKWGNCSKDKNISLNWRLIKSPEFVIDYVILHELLHTRIPNHSRIFWINLAILMPNYQESVNWLIAYGRGL